MNIPIIFFLVAIVLTASAFPIGSHPNPTDFYEGEIAELIVISSALDASQMNEINGVQPLQIKVMWRG